MVAWKGQQFHFGIKCYAVLLSDFLSGSIRLDAAENNETRALSRPVLAAAYHRYNPANTKLPRGTWGLISRVHSDDPVR